MYRNSTATYHAKPSDGYGTMVNEYNCTLSEGEYVQELELTPSGEAVPKSSVKIVTNYKQCGPWGAVHPYGGKRVIRGYFLVYMDGRVLDNFREMYFYFLSDCSTEDINP